jgi:NAD(P)H-dependent FMN reductase
MSRKRIFLFGTSLSKNSINRLFVEYTAKRLGNTKYTTTVTTVADYTNNLPVFSVEELAKGPNA